ncbi:MAG: hypothetical protein ABEK59_09430 [Halobacteria archaeon]
MDKKSKRLALQVILGIIAVGIGLFIIQDIGSDADTIDKVTALYMVGAAIALFCSGFGFGHLFKSAWGHGNGDARRVAYLMIPVFLGWLAFYIEHQLLGVWLALGFTFGTYLFVLGGVEIIRIFGRKTGTNQHYISKKRDLQDQWEIVEMEIEEEERERSQGR